MTSSGRNIFEKVNRLYNPLCAPCEPFAARIIPCLRSSLKDLGRQPLSINLLPQFLFRQVTMYL